MMKLFRCRLWLLVVVDADSLKNPECRLEKDFVTSGESSLKIEKANIEKHLFNVIKYRF